VKVTAGPWTSVLQMPLGGAAAPAEAAATVAAAASGASVIFMRTGAAYSRPVSALTRRRFLERTGFIAAAGVLAQLSDPAWVRAAISARPDLNHQTMSGLVAFIVPGPDGYSKKQGEWTKAPGGIAAGGTKALIDTLDLFIPSTPPLTMTVAAILNAQAMQLDPGIVPGPYEAPFANLAFQQKAEVFRRLEALDGPEAGALSFLAGNLPGLVAFLVYSDPRVGYKLSRYSGVADGRREFKGYFHA